MRGAIAGGAETFGIAEIVKNMADIGSESFE